MCMRLSGASELRKFWHFYILNLLFLSIFCRYIRYFVGTNDIACRLTCTDKIPNVPTNFQMYRQKSEKALLGGAAAPPCPPSGYANGAMQYSTCAMTVHNMACSLTCFFQNIDLEIHFPVIFTIL